MPHLDIRYLEAELRTVCARKPVDSRPACFRIETGRFKPFSAPTVSAAYRRGHRVEQVCDGVFNIYPSAEMLARVAGGAQK